MMLAILILFVWCEKKFIYTLYNSICTGKLIKSCRDSSCCYLFCC